MRREEQKTTGRIWKNLEMITTFRGSSIFFRFYFLILLMVIVLLISFTWYISRVIEGNVKEQYDQRSQQMLTRTANQMDNSLFFLEQIFSVAGNNKYVVDAAIRPGIEYDSRNLDVVSFLREIPRNNWFIENVWLHEQTTNTVFSSDGMVTSLVNYQYGSSLNGVLDQLKQGKGTQIAENPGRSRSVIIWQDESMYVVFESLKSKEGPFLSKLIGKISTEYLFASVTEEIESMQYGLVITDENSAFLFSNDKMLAGTKEEEQIMQASDYTGWNYHLYPVPFEGTEWSFYLKRILPFLLAATVGSLFFALVVAEKIYAPISDLTKHFSQKNENGIRSVLEESRENEIGFLYQSYSEVLQDKEKAEYLIMDIRPDLERKLFLSLLDGHEYTEEQLEQRLRDIRSSFCVHGNYCVMMVCFPDLEDLEDMASYLSIREIEQSFTEQFPAEHGQLLYVQKNSLGILVTQYPLEYSVAKIKAVEQCFEEQMRQRLQQQGVEAIFVCGKVYRNIKDIPLSYEEASDRLRRQIYFQNDGEAEETEEYVLTDSTQKYLMQQLAQMSELLGKSDMSAAEAQLQKILRELREKDVDLTFRRHYYEQLLDHLIEKSLQFYGEQNCFDSGEYQEIYRKLQILSVPEELADYVEEKIRKQFEFIRTQSLRRQNRIVAKAKEFIDENYDKGDLSIQLIAENVGISASYLSNLFATYTGENLISYINEYRINVAIHLLQSTTISIKEIGYKTGFNTAQNFNRVFKRITGLTPSKYREQKPENP